MNWRSRIVLVGILAAVTTAFASESPSVRVGSKKFTESVVIGEIITQLVNATGGSARHVAELGGTRILWNALLSGELDAYPEYTGTIEQELLPGFNAESLGKAGVRMTAPLGFNNTYAFGMKKETAQRLKIQKVSDLAAHPDLKFGLSEEFRQRTDGWPKVRERYGLPQRNVRGIDHDIGYRALLSGDIDVIDLYSTDAEIKYYDLQVLRDDRKVFPRYDAVILYRADLESRAPEAIEALRVLEHKISETEMIDLNARAKIEHVSAPEVAHDFIGSKFGIRTEGRSRGVLEQIWMHLKEHLALVALSMTLAISVAVPLGVLAAKKPRVGQLILTTAGIIQTIPALALLVMLIRPLKALGLSGIGDTPAIVALFLYSLLPMIRNTHAGLENLPLAIRESATALGLPAWTRLRLIELPMASPMILAGIKTAAVINVGFATLGALVGAGGFGQPILTGIRLDDYGLILQGAGPAAALAIVTQAFFALTERWFVPRGLRL